MSACATTAGLGGHNRRGCARARHCRRVRKASYSKSRAARVSAHCVVTPAHLSRCTPGVAILTIRLTRFDETGVTCRYKDYQSAADRQQVVILAADEFIRRLLPYVLPKGLPPHPPLRPARRWHPLGRARPCLPAARGRAALRSRCANRSGRLRPRCPCCRGHMVVEIFERERQPGAPPALAPLSGHRRRDPARIGSERARSTCACGAEATCADRRQTGRRREQSWATGARKPSIPA